MTNAENKKITPMHPGLHTDVSSDNPGRDSVLDGLGLPRTLEGRNSVLKALLDASSDAELEGELETHISGQEKVGEGVIVEFKRPTDF